jgi:tripartite-type tricarboxylate transporter receptor subunit TctC
MRSPLWFLLAGSLLFAEAAVSPLPAQGYPDRSVRLIVPFPAGGATDVTARILADELTAKFKQTFVVENRAGAAGTIGIDQVAKSKPDGYTLGVSGVGPTAIFAILDPKLSYNPARDLDMIAGLSAVDLFIIARLGFAPNNMKELIEYARANPGKVTYSTAGVAGPAQLQMESLALFANIKMLHVPFAGDTPAITAVLSGDVDIGIVAVASGVNFVTGGKLRALGVGGPTRLKALPDVPTVIEQTGFKEFTGYTWNVLVAAKGTPADVIDKLNAALNEISAKPEVVEKLANVGLRTLPGDVKTITGFVAGEAANYRRVIELTGVKRE